MIMTITLGLQPHEQVVAIEVIIKNENIEMVSKTKNKKRKFVSLTMQFLYDCYVGHDEERIQEFEQELFNAEIALKIYDLRTKAGLSQRELQKMVGTSASAICRLDDAYYDGHSLSMLKHTDEGLDKRVEIRFVSAKRRLQPA